MGTARFPGDLDGGPQPGSIFAGKYRIERLLGVGGMGYVLAATHVHLDERVAIKLLLPAFAQDGPTVARFLREGRAAVKIRSEHVGRILDVGVHESSPFIVMEYLDGCDLAQLLEREKKVPAALAVDYVLQASEAIAEAHAHQTVHRDLKPANLFLVQRAQGDCIKVLDFGISKTTSPEGTASLSMTKTSAIMGSPLYMSPEQLRSAKNVDARADIWALGVIVFELVSGRPPFVAQTLPELGAMVLSGALPDLRALAPDAPPGLLDVVATCLRTNPDDRYPTLAELAEAMAPFGTSAALASARVIARTLAGVPRPVRGSPSDIGTAATLHAASNPSLTANSWTATGASSRKKRSLVWVAGACIVALGVTAGVAWVRRERPPAPPTSAVVPPPPSLTAVTVSTTSTTSTITAPSTTSNPITTPSATHSPTVRRPAPALSAMSAPVPSSSIVPKASASSGFTNSRYE